MENVYSVSMVLLGIVVNLRKLWWLSLTQGGVNLRLYYNTMYILKQCGNITNVAVIQLDLIQ